MITAAFIFDLDGTLVDLPINYWAMFADFKQIMGTEKVQPILETLPKITDFQTRKRLFDTWERYEMASVPKTIVHEGGIRVYRAHTDKPKALVTMQSRKAAKVLIDKFKLSFNAVITREDSVNRAEQLKMAAQKLNVPMQNILFVGNMDNDEQAAKAVGCQFLRVK
ncbi:MAG: HAD family hydrolase [Candidatus Bathyarchaeota archaeon]|nr:HAD family hydrolase [Candidatus Bathyarchaeota archaeon]